MDCPRCGTRLTEEARFCTQCGAPVPHGEKRRTKRRALVLVLVFVVFALLLAGGVAFAAYEPPAHAAVSASSRAYARYRQDLADMSEQVKQAKENAFLAEEEHARLKRCLRNCLIAGVVIAAFMAPYLYGAMTDSGNDPASAVALGIFGGVSGLFMPFGFTPLKNFIRDHGFFIVFSWVFLAAAAVIAFAAIAGPIYLIYLIVKIKSWKRRAAELQAHSNNLTATYQAM